MTLSSDEELCRVLQFLDHLIQQQNIRELLPPPARLGNRIHERRTCFQKITFY